MREKFSCFCLLSRCRQHTTKHNVVHVVLRFSSDERNSIKSFILNYIFYILRTIWQWNRLVEKVRFIIAHQHHHQKYTVGIPLILCDVKHECTTSTIKIFAIKLRGSTAATNAQAHMHSTRRRTHSTTLDSVVQFVQWQFRVKWIVFIIFLSYRQITRINACCRMLIGLNFMIRIDMPTLGAHEIHLISKYSYCSSFLFCFKSAYKI